MGNVFCQGVDLHYLCSDHQERRKGQAALMAAAVERLVITLSTFPKLLVAAVNGDASGLGFTLLPLFDLVYANDKATFKTYYSRWVKHIKVNTICSLSRQTGSDSRGRRQRHAAAVHLRAGRGAPRHAAHGPRPHRLRAPRSRPRHRHLLPRPPHGGGRAQDEASLQPTKFRSSME